MDVQLTPAIRYWELEAHRTAVLLQELKASGVDSIGIWLPWAHFEDNGRAALRTFLRQAIHFNFLVRINICPEVSVGYFYGGIPADLLQKTENLARDRTGQIIYACAPPNIHPLVNLNAPAVFQRFGHLLLQLSQEISDLLEDNIEGKVELIIGDSFFKHYSTCGLPPEDHGEYSAQFFQRELSFMQNWSAQQAERTFTRRALQFLQTRFEYSQEVKLSTKNYCMRSASLDRLVDELSGSELDPKQFFSRMTSQRSHCNAIWLDTTSGIEPKERSFLISAALTMYGDVWLPAEEYLRTTSSFRQKISFLSNNFSLDTAFYDRPVLVVVQNRFAPTHLSKAVEQRVGRSVEFLCGSTEIETKFFENRKLILYEDTLKISVEQFQNLLAITKEKNINIALFRSSLCKKGLAEASCLDKFRFRSGWTYEVAVFQSGGHLILIEGQEYNATTIEQLADRILSVAEIDSWCKYNKKVVSHVSIRTNAKSEDRILFFYNPTENPQDLEISFHRDFQLEGVEFQNKKNNFKQEQFLGDELSAQMPPWSVVPLSVNTKAHTLPIEDSRGVEDGASESLVQI